MGAQDVEKCGRRSRAMAINMLDGIEGARRQGNRKPRVCAGTARPYLPGMPGGRPAQPAGAQLDRAFPLLALVLAVLYLHLLS